MIDKYELDSNSNSKPKQKHKKTVVQILTNGDNNDDEDITELIKESVKEALHSEPPRPQTAAIKQSNDQFEAPV